jgi:hypothetical protein
MISIVIPTVTGRESYLANCIASYESRTCTEFEMIVETDHPTVGLAWQAGAEKAEGEFIHLTNDDLEPRDGWSEPAIEAIGRGYLPAPQVYGVAGDPQAPPAWGSLIPDWTPLNPPHAAVVPFISREMWEKVYPLFTAHYYTDNFITARVRMAGWPCVVRSGYAFTNHWAQHKRGAGMSESERMKYDLGLYAQALDMVAAGEWAEPWPPGGRL